MATEEELYEQFKNEEALYQQFLSESQSAPDTKTMTQGAFDTFQSDLDKQSGYTPYEMPQSTDQGGNPISIGGDSPFLLPGGPDRTSELTNTPFSKQDGMLPFLTSTLVQDGMTTVGGMTGWAAGGPLGGAAGGAIGNAAGDFAMQGIDNAYNRFFVDRPKNVTPPPAELSNPVTFENLATGAIGGLLSKPGAAISSQIGESAGSFLDDVGKQMPDIPAPSRPSGLFGPSQIDQTTLADPQVQRTLGYIERNAPENLPGGKAANVSRVNQNTRDIVESVQGIAGMGEKGLGAPLGAMSGDTKLVRSLSDNFYAKVPAVEKSGIFEQAQDVPELITLAQEGIQRSYQEKRALVDQLSGVINITPDDLATELTPLRQRIERLRRSGFNSEFVQQMDSTLSGLLSDVGNRHRFGAGEVADVLEDINEYRRKVLREFDSGNVAARAVGDQGSVAASREALEVLAESQSAFKSAFDKQLQRAASANPQLAQHIGRFQQLLDEYGGYQAVEELAQQFHHGTLKGLSTREGTRVVQNLGAEGALNAFDPQRGVKQNVLGMVGEGVQNILESGGYGDSRPGVKALKKAVNRDTTAMENVRDILSLRSNPATLPGQGTVPAHPDLGMKTHQSAMARMSTLPQSIVSDVTGFNAAGGPGSMARMAGEANPAGVAASGMVGEMGPALHDDGRPTAIQTSITPSFQPDEMPGNIPRHIGAVDPRMVGSLLTQFAGPQDAVPLGIQAAKVFASKDQKEIGRFLGALSERYPDMPFERGPITGYASEWQMDDGSSRLFSDIDIKKWANEVESSPLREDEKAQRLRALHTDGTVYPLDKKLVDYGPPMMVDDSMNAPASIDPHDLALQNLLKENQFEPRTRNQFGSKKVEQ
jgi:hypothetical protein